MNPAPQILVVDDDEGITSLLREYLARFSFTTHAARDGASMREQLQAQPIDLVVLDLMLPGTDGLTLAREVRSRSLVPIIMLTARASHYDRVLGLELGADDYMTKPFEPRELVARIQTVLRRAKAQNDASATQSQASADIVCFGGWALHRHERHVVAPTGVVVPLSNAEYRLLTSFLAMPRRLCTREWLMEQARGRTLDSTDRSIDLLVSRLRQKLQVGPEAAPLIKTIRGAGYMLDVQRVHAQPVWQA
jgi:two-component system OmpR family response regulator